MTISRTSAKNDSNTEPAPRNFRLKVIGVGGAGGNAINQFASAPGLAGAELIAANTDVQALTSVAGAEHLQLGAAVTHGLGAGGDVEQGARAAQLDAERIEAAVQSADVVFLVAGLGGGTGTGASPVIARLAKEQGALVLAFVALPFAFEGDRRRQQALAGLDQLKMYADAVICLPNDKLFKIVGENAQATEAFHRGNEIIGTGVQAIWQLLSRKGLINLDFADLRTTLGSTGTAGGHGVRHSEGIFSHGEAAGADKAREAVKALLENPLFDGGEVLAKAEGVLVSVRGGPDLTLADVQRVVEPISKAAGRAHLIMGAAIDDNFEGKLAITVIAATSVQPRRPVAVAPAARPSVSFTRPADRPTKPAAAPAQAELPAAVAAAPLLEAPPKKEPVKPKQAELPMEKISRGRFEKSEPTVYDGEDLDVPTYLRRGVNLRKC